MRHRPRVIVAIACVGVSAAWIAISGLRGDLVYYRTPTELLEEGRTAVGQPTRLGGLVLPGSVDRQPGQLRFSVSDGTTEIVVLDTSDVPQLFRAGRGVVLEGTYGVDGVFHADAVMVRHDDDYRPPTTSAMVGGG
jgi:cytochrome c-type biogenesis protein CcmE